MKWAKQRNENYGKTEKNYLETWQWRNGKNNIHPKKELHTIKNKKTKNYTIGTKFDKFVTKVSMIETPKKVYEEKVTKENNISLSRDPTTSFPSGIVDTSDKNYT